MASEEQITVMVTLRPSPVPDPARTASCLRDCLLDVETESKVNAEERFCTAAAGGMFQAGSSPH